MDNLSMVFSFFHPNIIIGIGAVENVGKIAQEIGATKALIVTDAGVASAALLDVIKNSLQKGRIEFGIFEGCLPDAPLNVIEECTKTVKKGNYNLIIGVGGGSVIDTAKVASLRLASEVDVRNILGFDQVKESGIPKIFIPTTAGTGSELTRAAVITDTKDGQKKVIFSKYLRANTAIIDPLMTLNLPPKVTADSGMDALSHAIEAYGSWKANIISDMYAEKTIQLVTENLCMAYAKGRKHPEARYKLSVAAALGILAGMGSGSGLAHSMNYPIAVKAKITHGAALGIILPYVMEYNLVGNPSKYAKIADLMGENTQGLSQMDAAQKSAEAVRKLAKSLGMPQRLQDVGIKKEDICEFVDYLFNFQLYQIENNPRDLTREDATRIFEAAL